MAKEMKIEKSVTINKPLEEVFDYLKITRNQEKFSVWNMKDPGKKVTSSGTDGTVGYIYSWDSKDKNVGAGSQEIKQIVDNEKIVYEVRFDRPMKNVAETKFILRKVSESRTEVTWSFSGPTKFPMSLLAPLFKKMLEKDILTGLENLKKNLDQPDPNT